VTVQTATQSGLRVLGEEMLATGGWQMLSLNIASACTCPAYTPVIVYCRELNLFILNSVAGVIFVFDLNDIVADLNMFNVFAEYVVFIGETSGAVIVRPSAVI